MNRFVSVLLLLAGLVTSSIAAIRHTNADLVEKAWWTPQPNDISLGQKGRVDVYVQMGARYTQILAISNDYWREELLARVIQESLPDTWTAPIEYTRQTVGASKAAVALTTFSGAWRFRLDAKNTFDAGKLLANFSQAGLHPVLRISAAAYATTQLSGQPGSQQKTFLLTADKQPHELSLSVSMGPRRFALVLLGLLFPFLSWSAYAFALRKARLGGKVSMSPAIRWVWPSVILLLTAFIGGLSARNPHYAALSDLLDGSFRPDVTGALLWTSALWGSLVVVLVHFKWPSMQHRWHSTPTVTSLSLPGSKIAFVLATAIMPIVIFALIGASDTEQCLVPLFGFVCLIVVFQHFLTRRNKPEIPPLDRQREEKLVKAVFSLASAAKDGYEGARVSRSDPGRRPAVEVSGRGILSITYRAALELTIPEVEFLAARVTHAGQPPTTFFFLPVIASSMALSITVRSLGDGNSAMVAAVSLMLGVSFIMNWGLKPTQLKYDLLADATALRLTGDRTAARSAILKSNDLVPDVPEQELETDLRCRLAALEAFPLPVVPASSVHAT